MQYEEHSLVNGGEVLPRFYCLVPYQTNRRKGNIWSSFFTTETKTEESVFVSIGLEKTNNAGRKPTNHAEGET